jgi:hypothetical protein
MSQFETTGKRQDLPKFVKSAIETFHIIKRAYSEEALSRSAVFKWHKHFAKGRERL